MTRRDRLQQFAAGYGLRIADRSVCRGHHAPIDFVESWVYDRPDLSLVLGPRGGGKSYLAGFATHVDSIRYPGHETKILGGSLAQSAQIYSALGDFRDTLPGLRDLSLIAEFNRGRATYANDSEVTFIPASPKSVRGPHVPTLRLDEVDEMDSEIRQSALGMCMAKGGVRASVSMTSTWHRVGGPMAELLERGENGDFPVFRFCAFEVLESCPVSRSGPNYEHCGSCPLVAWCHSDREEHDGVPKAKRSNGHYSIDALIQKVKGTSARIFESDYLCLGPKADGMWFRTFLESGNVTDAAEFCPDVPYHVSIDSGVFTGGVMLQMRERNENGLKRVVVNIFDDYLAEGQAAESNALAILGQAKSRCGDNRRRISTDSAGGARNPVGPSVIAEYQRVGLTGERGIEQWPRYPGCVATGLATIEALVRSADGQVSLLIHPRCKRTIDAFRSYRRARRAGQWQDYPEDPQHPHEDLIDAVRGVLAILLPQGLKPEPKLKWLPVKKVF